MNKAEDQRPGRDVIRVMSLAFTQKAGILAEQVRTGLIKNKRDWIIWENTDHLTADQFAASDLILFVCASGIAVRKIAPFLKDKMSDPAVLVIDENGKFVISLVSGHLGGANRYAAEVAGILGAMPVITTATDGRKLPAMDVWAAKHGLAMSSRRLAKKIMAELLNQVTSVTGLGSGERCMRQNGKVADCTYGENRENVKRETNSDCAREQDDWKEVHVNCMDLSDSGPVCKSADSRYRICFLGEDAEIYDLSNDDAVEQFVHEHIPGIDSADVLFLRPKRYVIGVGCRRGTEAAEMEGFLREFLHENRIETGLIERICSIDLKKEELCIKQAARGLNVPYTVFSADELQKLEGDFSSSDFVRKTTGVDNVCERSALLGAGVGSSLIVKKTARRGMTAAAALCANRTGWKNSWTVTPWEWVELAEKDWPEN